MITNRPISNCYSVCDRFSCPSINIKYILWRKFNIFDFEKWINILMAACQGGEIALPWIWSILNGPEGQGSYHHLTYHKIKRWGWWYWYQSVTNIFEYSNIFDPNIYSDIRSYHFLDTNIFGYSFVARFWFQYIRIFVRINFQDTNRFRRCFCWFSLDIILCLWIFCWYQWSKMLFRL